MWLLLLILMNGETVTVTDIGPFESQSLCETAGDRMVEKVDALYECVRSAE